MCSPKRSSPVWTWVQRWRSGTMYSPKRSPVWTWAHGSFTFCFLTVIWSKLYKWVLRLQRILGTCYTTLFSQISLMDSLYIPRECVASAWSALDSLTTVSRAAEPFTFSWKTLGNGDRPPAFHLSCAPTEESYKKWPPSLHFVVQIQPLVVATNPDSNLLKLNEDRRLNDSQLI